MPNEKNTSKRVTYLIDTNAFIAFENLYPIDNWRPLWDFLADQVDAGIIMTIDDVIQELEKLFYDNKITEWVRARRDKIKFEKTPDHFQHLTSTVYVKCNGLIDPDFTGTLYADPELLAVASFESFTIVTDEVKITEEKNTNPLNLRLPNHCPKLGVPCIYGRYAWPELLKKIGFSVSSVKIMPTISNPNL